MKQENIIFIGLILILLLFVQKLISFLRYKYLLNRNLLIQIKFHDYNNFKWGALINSLMMMIIGCFYLKKVPNYILPFWFIIILTLIIDCFISPDNYLLINSKGIRQHYDSKIIEWKNITSVALSNEYSNVIIITLKKRKAIQIFGDKVDFDQLAMTVKDFDKDIYENRFKNQ